MSEIDPQNDRRVQEWKLRKGLISEDQLQEYLKKLPDVKDKAEHLGTPATGDKPAEPPNGKAKSR